MVLLVSYAGIGHLVDHLLHGIDLTRQCAHAGLAHGEARSWMVRSDHTLLLHHGWSTHPRHHLLWRLKVAVTHHASHLLLLLLFLVMLHSNTHHLLILYSLLLHLIQGLLLLLLLQMLVVLQLLLHGIHLTAPQLTRRNGHLRLQQILNASAQMLLLLTSHHPASAHLQRRLTATILRSVLRSHGCCGAGLHLHHSSE
jgi:hypothetical protein